MSLAEIAAAVSWSTTIYETRAVAKGTGNRAVESYWISLFCIAIAVTLAAWPQLLRSLEQSLALPGLDRLVEDSLLVMGVAFAAYGGFISLIETRLGTILRRSVMVAAGATVTIMTVLFLSVHPSTAPTGFVGDYSIPRITAYRLTFIADVAVTLAALGTLWATHVLTDIRLSVRLGFSTMLLGAILGLAYLANDLGIVARGIGWSGATWWGVPALANPLRGFGGLFALVGGLAGMWASALTALRCHIASFRLRPLRRALRPAERSGEWLPEPSWWVALLDVRDAQLCLRVELEEIRDAAVQIVRFADPKIPGIAHEAAASRKLKRADRDAFMEAAMLHAGLRAWSAGAPEQAGFSYDLPGHRNFWDEVHHLERVSRWIGKS